MRTSAASALAVLAIVGTPAAAHSWVEQLMVINSKGQFTGNPGYARGNIMRGTAGFSDPAMVHILPGQGQPTIEQRDVASDVDTQGILPSDPMCKKTQQAQTQSNGSPRLQAAAGDMVALRYQENGHVTLPKNQPGKPPNRGNVYIYGTTQPKPDEKFLEIYKKWTADGTGGDKRGVLLATQPFDDGQCYQVNGGDISGTRQKDYPHTAGPLMGADLWCQNDIKIPANAPSGKPYTIYWVWDWPTQAGVDPGLPKGKAEIYTTCLDIDIKGTKASRDLEERQAPAPAGNNIANMAIPKYVKALAASPVGGQQPAASPVPQTPPAQSPAPQAPAAKAAAPVPAQPNAAQPVTVTVTVGTPAPAKATQAPAAQPAPQAPAPAKMPPANLQIAPPAFAGTASNLAPTTLQTAVAPAKTQQGAVGARSCPDNKCQQKRSRIFGSAAH